jgi:hypothetical protein
VVQHSSGFWVVGTPIGVRGYVLQTMTVTTFALLMRCIEKSAELPNAERSKQNARV